MKNILNTVIILIGILGCGKAQVISPTIVTIDDLGTSWQMELLYIDFQEGFLNTPVSISIENKTIFCEIISTNQDGTGFAKRIQTKMPSKDTSIQFSLSGEKWDIVLDISKRNFIGISLMNNKPKVEQSKNFFLYD